MEQENLFCGPIFYVSSGLDCQIRVGKSFIFSDCSSIGKSDSGGWLGKNLEGLLMKSVGWVLGTGDGPYFILCSGSDVFIIY